MYILLIREYRLARGLTQRQLAKKSRLRQAYISQLEKNCHGTNETKSPTLRSMFRIARALDVCPHILVQYYIPCNKNCLNICKKKIFMHN